MQINNIGIDSSEIFTFIITAIEGRSSEEMIRYLIPLTTKHHLTLMLYAAQYDNIDVMRNINMSSMTPLHIFNAVYCALEHGANSVLKYITDTIHPSYIDAKYKLN